MAVLKLTLDEVSCFEQQITTTTYTSLPSPITLGKSSSISYNGATKSVSISSEKNGKTLYLNCKDDDINRDIHGYTFDMVEYKFQKKMYQPTEILAHIQINMASGETWSSIGRKRIESTFKHKQVKLEVDGDSIGDDFYVHAVLPSYKSDSMIVELKIYSLDKLLTLDKSCNSYVAKKLGSDILSSCMDNSKNAIDTTTDAFKKVKDRYYFKPYDKNKLLQFKIQNMQVLYFENSNNESVEHMFPYLVQYNESFYDMLIRTCNRWGEFVFWENGQLNIGYNSAKTEPKSKGSKEMVYKTIPDKYKTLTFPNIDKTSSIAPDNSQYYFPVGADDSTIRDTNAQKSKWYAKAKIFAYGGMGDMYWMQKFNQFFLNNKNWATFLATTFAEDMVAWGKEEADVADKNSSYNGEYFPKSDTTDEQYGKATFKGVEKDGMNEFTEIGTNYNDKKYKEILKYELKAMENVMEIDYDTTWPGLKLGEIIVEENNNETFIVVEVDCEKNSKGSPVFRIKAIGSSDGTGNKFYPPMLATGHVRYSGPQKATVEEASSEDPCDQNRVRVAFPWQMEPKKNPTDEDSWIGDLSPRIRIASADGGANMASRFYKGDSVMIGFIDGNIERPYVLGSIPVMGTLMNNVHTMSTPGGHALNLTDGSGEGLVSFLSNAILPVYNSLAGWLPSSISSNVAKWAGEWDKNKYFEGGFTLSDKYGIYRINGSTDGRRITIMSPWGDVMINAFTGINIMAPNGDVNIVGKNVSIAAGNKLSLTSGTNIAKKLKGDTKGKQTLDWLENIPAAIAEALTKKYFKLLDLSLVRSAVDIVLRPVEGTLTLKSMRFMKLEAGMRTRCDFPALAYNKKKQQQVDKQDIKDLVSMGSSDEEKSLTYGTIKAFEKISAFADKLLNDYLTRYNDLRRQKIVFTSAIDVLKEVANNREQPVCSTYDELKNYFWADGEYQEWTEDKLGFIDDNVGTEPDYVFGIFFTEEYSEVPLQTQKQFNKETNKICMKREKSREIVLSEANKLRKMICEFLNFDVTLDIVNATFGALGVESEPADFKEKIKTAASKAKCPNSIIYIALTDFEKNLNNELYVPVFEKPYLRRLIVYNLLIALGFDKDTRREIILEGDENTTAIAEPDTDDIDTNGAASLINDEYWNHYVQSLSGVPVIKKQNNDGVGKTIAKGVGKAALDASGISTAMSFAELRNHSIWGEGKDGRVLIGADGKTFEFKNNTFSEIETIEPSSKYYTSDSAGLKEDDQANLISFMDKLKTELLNC